MPTAVPAVPSTRVVSVPPERLERWLAGFAERHGTPTIERTPEREVRTAPDGAVASCVAPFPPLIAGLVEHTLTDRRVGVLLVRLGGYAAGIFEGRTLTSSKVGSRQVHGRSAAGGQSQQRFARRREGQVRVALTAAADNAVRILVPEAARLDAVVVGGDRTAVEQVLADRRLAPLLALVQPDVLDVPDPRLTVLRATPEAFRSVRIHLSQPDGT